MDKKQFVMFDDVLNMVYILTLHEDESVEYEFDGFQIIFNGERAAKQIAGLAKAVENSELVLLGDLNE